MSSRLDSFENFFDDKKYSDKIKGIFEACKNGDIIRVKLLLNKDNIDCRDDQGRKSTPLHIAAGFGRQEVVNYLIQIGADVDIKDEGGLIPLHNACSFGHYEVVQLLLKHKSDPNSTDNWNFTPLHEAVIKGKAETCLILIQYGANFNLSNSDGKSAFDIADPVVKSVFTGEYKKDELLEASKLGNEEKFCYLLTPYNTNCHADDGRMSTPLHLASGYNITSIVKILLKNGADPQVKDKGGLVPLHNASSYGHFEIAELLINHGADVNAQDLWHFTPLHEAAHKNRLDVCSLLISHGADPTLLNCHGRSTFDCAYDDELRTRMLYEYRGIQFLDAIRKSDMGRIKKFVNELHGFKHPLSGDNALHVVSQSQPTKKKQIIDYLIKKGCDLNEKNNDMLTPFHVAADLSHIDIMDQLFKCGAKIDSLDTLNQTALHRSAKQGTSQICKALLAYGIDPNIVSLHGFKAVNLASNLETLDVFKDGHKGLNRSTSVKSQVKKKGSNKQEMDVKSKAIEVGLPCQSEDIKKVEIIPQTGDLCSYDIVEAILEACKIGDIQTFLKLIKTYPDMLYCKDLEGRHSTPLHFAAGYNRVAIAELLLDMGANVHARDKGGLIPLHNACSYNHTEMTEKLLLKGHTCPDTPDLWGYTALHEAAAKGKFDMCKILLKYGADPLKVNRDGLTARALYSQSFWSGS
ncbi:unnamed protein product [Gordionus sp. m RMFG-2023]